MHSLAHIKFLICRDSGAHSLPDLIPMSSAKKTVEKIRQIVQLKLMMKRWKAMSSLKNFGPVTAHHESDDSDSFSNRHRRVPSGFLAVYVGEELRRFLIPTRYLKLPVFVSLLDKAEEEFGFQTDGGLHLPCEVGVFKGLLKALERDEERFKGLDLEEVSSLFSEVALDPCKETTNSSGGFKPLLKKTRV